MEKTNYQIQGFKGGKVGTKVKVCLSVGQKGIKGEYQGNCNKGREKGGRKKTYRGLLKKGTFIP